MEIIEHKVNRSEAFLEQTRASCTWLQLRSSVVVLGSHFIPGTLETLKHFHARSVPGRARDFQTPHSRYVTLCYWSGEVTAAGSLRDFVLHSFLLVDTRAYAYNKKCCYKKWYAINLNTCTMHTFLSFAMALVLYFVSVMAELFFLSP